MFLVFIIVTLMNKHASALFLSGLSNQLVYFCCCAVYSILALVLGFNGLISGAFLFIGSSLRTKSNACGLLFINHSLIQMSSLNFSQITQTVYDNKDLSFWSKMNAMVLTWLVEGN